MVAHPLQEMASSQIVPTSNRPPHRAGLTCTSTGQTPPCSPETPAYCATDRVPLNNLSRQTRSCAKGSEMRDMRNSRQSNSVTTWSSVETLSMQHRPADPEGLDGQDKSPRVAVTTMCAKCMATPQAATAVLANGIARLWGDKRLMPQCISQSASVRVLKASPKTYNTTRKSTTTQKSAGKPNMKPVNMFARFCKRGVRNNLMSRITRVNRSARSSIT